MLRLRSTSAHNVDVVIKVGNQSCCEQHCKTILHLVEPEYKMTRKYPLLE